jgi:ribonuclease BN (tRNA processing enzyme)
MLNSEMTEAYKKFLSGVDLLVTDSQFDEEGIEQFKGWGHSSITGFIDLLKDAKVKTMALFHHNPQTPESYIDGLYQGAQEHLNTVIPDGSTNLICAIEGQSLTL